MYDKSAPITSGIKDIPVELIGFFEQFSARIENVKAEIEFDCRCEDETRAHYTITLQGYNHMPYLVIRVSAIDGSIGDICPMLVATGEGLEPTEKMLYRLIHSEDKVHNNVEYTVLVDSSTRGLTSQGISLMWRAFRDSGSLDMFEWLVESYYSIRQ